MADCLAGVEALADTLRGAGRMNADGVVPASSARTSTVRCATACASRSTDGRSSSSVDATGLDRRDADTPCRLDDSRVSPTATATPSTGRCAGAPSASAGRSGPGASRCTPSPSGSTPDTYFELARDDVRRDARGRDHRGRRVPLPAPPARRHAVRRPERDGHALARPRPRGRASGSRCSTPATSPPASAQQPRGRAGAAISDGDAHALGDTRRRARRVAEAAAADDVVVGAAIHSVRAVPARPDAAGGRLGRPREAPLHVHLSEQVAENDAVPGGVRRDPDRSCSPTPARSADGPPPCTPPTSPTTTSRLLGERRQPTPASARPPSATSATASARRRRLHDAGAPLTLGSDSHAVIDLFEEMRAVEMHERLATQRARPLVGRRAARRGDRRRPRARSASPDAGRIAVGAARRPGHRSTPRASRTAGTGADARPRSSPRPAPTSCTCSGDGVDVTLDPPSVGAELDRVIRRLLGGAMTQRRCCTGIGELSPTHRARRASVGTRPDAALSWSSAAGWPGSARPRRRPAADRRTTSAAARWSPGFVDSHSHLVFAGDRGRGVRGPDGRRALLRRRHPHHRRRDPRGDRRAAHRQRRPARRRDAPPGHDHRRDQERLRAHRPRRGPRRWRSRGSSPRRPRSSARTSCPPEYADDPAGYVDLVTGPMLDACRAARAAGSTCSARPAPSTPTRRGRSCSPGAARGLGGRLHANQLGPGPGVRLACELGLAAVDHCTYLDDADVAALARLAARSRRCCPAWSSRTRSPYPDARRCSTPACTVALASDCNPGSCYTSLDAAVRRAGGARDADDAGRGAVVGDRRRRPRARPRRRRPARRRGARGPTRCSTRRRTSTSPTGPVSRWWRRSPARPSEVPETPAEAEIRHLPMSGPTSGSESLLIATTR